MNNLMASPRLGLNASSTHALTPVNPITAPAVQGESFTLSDHQHRYHFFDRLARAPRGAVARPPMGQARAA